MEHISQRLQEGPAEVEVSLSIEDLTSLLVGTARFQSLYRYGMARISDERYVETIGRLFAVGQKPVCTTSFLYRLTKQTLASLLLRPSP
ncbi:MAG: sterol carrier protein domain-containing protein [Anaerolineae bacterium]|nr:sterol carrier protein domain-containing protein [Anaerolineae bacterium]